MKYREVDFEITADVKIKTQADKRNEKPSWLFGDRRSDEVKVRIVLLVHVVSSRVFTAFIRLSAINIQGCVAGSQS